MWWLDFGLRFFDIMLQTSPFPPSLSGQVLTTCIWSKAQEIGLTVQHLFTLGSAWWQWTWVYFYSQDSCDPAPWQIMTLLGTWDTCLFLKHRPQLQGTASTQKPLSHRPSGIPLLVTVLPPTIKNKVYHLSDEKHTCCMLPHPHEAK